ncbi:hypothetical protein [Streptomyces anulatus]|uniref:hypothetical protein n=1 Tax=Streptomyces anulatus TaxID=1892 RepID=UPI002ED181C6|nr:hypothetical protein OG882_04610 [Streptomyces anulatus]WUD92892.1 hypothetical protein OG703_34030 [Streptomyces anulatus]
MEYVPGIPSTSSECACEAERLLQQANRANDAAAMGRLIAAADVWAKLSLAAAQREGS